MQRLPAAILLAATILAATAAAQLTLHVSFRVKQAPGLTLTRPAENVLEFTLTGTAPPSGQALYSDVLEIHAGDEAYILLSGNATLILDGTEHSPGEKIRLTPGTHTASLKVTAPPGARFTAKARLELLPPLLTYIYRPSPLAVAAAATLAAAAAAYAALHNGGRTVKAPLAGLYLLLKTPEEALRHRGRQGIVELLRRRPGLTARRIARIMGMSLGEAQWHLSVLERVGTVKSVPISKWRAYFLAGTPPHVWLHGFLREQGCDVPLELVEANMPLLRELLKGRARMSQIRRLLGC